MTRRQFDDQLDEIKALIHRMGDCVTEMLDLATQLAFAFDEGHYARIQALDDIVDRSEEQAMTIAVEAIMRQSPVAGDLRLLASTLSIVGELEQAGDDAEKLAGRARKMGDALPEEFKAALFDMQQEACEVLRLAVSLYDHYDDEVAERILEADNAVDFGYKSARKRVVALIEEHPQNARQLLRLIGLFHALEHAADRGVEITKRLRMHSMGHRRPAEEAPIPHDSSSI